MQESLLSLFFAGPYPDCNFTDGLGGWKNGKKLHWGVVKSKLKDVGMLTGVQGKVNNDWFLEAFQAYLDEKEKANAAWAIYLIA